MLHCFKVTTDENRLMIWFLQGRRSSYRYYDIYGEMTIKKRLSHIIKKEDDTWERQERQQLFLQHSQWQQYPQYRQWQTRLRICMITSFSQEKLRLGTFCILSRQLIFRYWPICMMVCLNQMSMASWYRQSQRAGRQRTTVLLGHSI